MILQINVRPLEMKIIIGEGLVVLQKMLTAVIGRIENVSVEIV